MNRMEEDTLVVIEESNEEQELLGMLLSPQGDLSHTSILYYYHILQQFII